MIRDPGRQAAKLTFQRVAAVIIFLILLFGIVHRSVIYAVLPGVAFCVAVIGLVLCIESRLPVSKYQMELMRKKADDEVIQTMDAMEGGARRKRRDLE